MSVGMTAAVEAAVAKALLVVAMFGADEDVEEEVAVVFA